MSINVKELLGGAARVAAGAALLVAAGSAVSPAHAKKLSANIASTTGGTGPGPLLSTFFDLGYADEWSDGTITLTNPTSLVSSTTDLCAYIFVFDNSEELQEACGVPVSANGTTSFPITELTSYPAFASGFGSYLSGVVEIVSGAPNGGTSDFAQGTGCDPAAVIATPETGINAWITQPSYATVDSVYTTPVAVAVPFIDEGEPDSTNLATLQGLVADLASVGGSSGDGICLYGDL